MVKNNTEEFIEAPNKIFITILIMAAAVMQTIDSTIANVALPRMQGSLSATQDEISWVLSLLRQLQFHLLVG
jgi:hypothetical protein